MAHVFGPVEGRRHDAAMLRMSNLDHQLNLLNGNLCLYGDQAYPLRPNLMCPFRGNNLTVRQQEFNNSMAKLRISVEWTFGNVIKLFAFVDYKKNHKLLLQPIGKYYIVASFLTNCHSCFYGNQTSQYFNIDPPNLNVYLQ